MPLGPDDLVRMLREPKGRLRTVLDTDTYNEVDDQFALTQIVLSPGRSRWKPSMPRRFTTRGRTDRAIAWN